MSPRSKCYCFSYFTACRIQKLFLSVNHGGQQYFSVFHGPFTLKSILLALFHQQAILLLYITQFKEIKTKVPLFSVLILVLRRKVLIKNVSCFTFSKSLFFFIVLSCKYIVKALHIWKTMLKADRKER